MRHKKIMVILATALMVFALAACGGVGLDESEAGGGISGQVAELRADSLASFDHDEGDYLPEQLLVEDGVYYLFSGAFDSGKYQLSVGEDLSALDKKYEGSYYYELWEPSVERGNVLWMERQEEDDGETFFLRHYDGKTGEVSAIWSQLKGEDDYIHPRAFLYDGRAYLMRADRKEKTLLIDEVDPATGKVQTVFQGDFYDESFGGAYHLEGQTLYFEDTRDRVGNRLVALDLVSGEPQYMTLPESVERVFALDFEDDICALYYYDNTEGDNPWNQAENMGWLRGGEDTVKPVFSFPKDGEGTYIASLDRLVLNEGKMYWVYEQNITGYVSELYHLTRYDIEEEAAQELPRTFAFFARGEDCYALSWEEEDDDTTRVNILRLKE